MKRIRLTNRYAGPRGNFPADTVLTVGEGGNVTAAEAEALLAGGYAAECAAVETATADPKTETPEAPEKTGDEKTGGEGGDEKKPKAPEGAPPARRGTPRSGSRRS